MCHIRKTAKSFRTTPACPGVERCDQAEVEPVRSSSASHARPSEIYIHFREGLTATAAGLSNSGARATNGTPHHKHGTFSVFTDKRLCQQTSAHKDVPASTGRIRNVSECNKKVRRHFFNIILELMSLNIPGDTNSSDPPPPPTPSSLAHLREPLHSMCPDNKWRVQKDSSFTQQQPTLA